VCRSHSVHVIDSPFDPRDCGTAVHTSSPGGLGDQGLGAGERGFAELSVRDAFVSMEIDVLEAPVLAPPS